jgi:hypothetical protein
MDSAAHSSSRAFDPRNDLILSGIGNINGRNGSTWFNSQQHVSLEFTMLDLDLAANLSGG